ncbi:MAG: dienelactone hydrolase family protein [Elusimicrobia bacterium]|nr:dienelactone hydrolase family protein [Elusimicrobiota bacterium]
MPDSIRRIALILAAALLLNQCGRADVERLEKLLRIRGPWAWDSVNIEGPDIFRLPNFPFVGEHAPIRIKTLRMRTGVDSAKAFLALPPEDIFPGKRPAVIVLHGHLSHPDELVALSTSVNLWSVGALLASRGFVVLAPEIRWEPQNLKNEIRQTFQLLLSGRIITGERTADVLRAADFLARHPRVDARRLGILGWSMGGQIALYAAALEPALRAVYISASFAPYAILLHPDAPLQSPDNYVPFLLSDFGDKDQIAALIKPRPILIEHGEQDPTESFEGVDHMANQLALHYGRHGQERLSFIRHRFDHRFYGADAVEWFERWLK